MRAPRVLGVLAAALGALAPPAHASFGTVTYTIASAGAPGVGRAIACHVHATPPPGYASFQTMVACVVNGLVIFPVVYPGGDAVGAGVHVGAGPATVCVWGTASYLELKAGLNTKFEQYDFGCHLV